MTILIILTFLTLTGGQGASLLSIESGGSYLTTEACQTAATAVPHNFAWVGEAGNYTSTIGWCMPALESK